MNEHVKAWLAALRSGKYQQVQKRLRKGSGFCCLGVACDIVDPKRWIENEEAPGSYVYQADGEPEFDLVAIAFPPVSIREAMGFDYEFYNRLWELNDLHDYTFEQIADHIEASIKDGSAYK